MLSQGIRAGCVTVRDRWAIQQDPITSALETSGMHGVGLSAEFFTFT